MASTISKKPCAKCDKGAGILTCDGCQQSFCAKHIADHRQELSMQMDTIGQECDLLRRDLFRDDTELSPLSQRINMWEQESIVKIQQIAQQARNDLQQYSDQNKTHLKNRFGQLTEQLQSSRQSESYTEIDFKLWTEKLVELRKILEKPLNIDLIEDDKTVTSISMIKIKQRIDRNVSNPSQHQILTTQQLTPRPIFNQFVGDATFSENSLVATHTGDPRRSTMAFITESYTSGIHQIRFRIERKLNKYLFFGIINSREQMDRNVFYSPSLYGWMSPDVRIVKSRKLLSANLNTKFNQDDQVLLTLNCNTQQIILEHPQTNTIDHLRIDLHVCAFPWRVVIAFFSQYDSVRISH